MNSSSAYADEFSHFLREQVLEMESLENFYHATASRVIENENLTGESGCYSVYLSDLEKLRSYLEQYATHFNGDCVVLLGDLIVSLKEKELFWAISKHSLNSILKTYEQREVQDPELQELILSICF